MIVFPCSASLFLLACNTRQSRCTQCNGIVCWGRSCCCNKQKFEKGGGSWIGPLKLNLMYCTVARLTAVPVVATALSLIIIILVQCVIVPVYKIKYFFLQFGLLWRPWKAFICYIFYVYMYIYIYIHIHTYIYIYVYCVFLSLCSLLFIKENVRGLK
jgi:hypothetical protein